MTTQATRGDSCFTPQSATDSSSPPVVRGVVQWPDLVARVQLEPEVGEECNRFQPLAGCLMGRPGGRPEQIVSGTAGSVRFGRVSQKQLQIL